jgi:hypothetical protein
MRDKDRSTVGGLRSVLAALENAEAVPVAPEAAPSATSEHVAGGAVGVGAGEAARRTLSRDEERDVLGRELAELRQSAVTLAEAGRPERGAELVRVAVVVEQLLEE